METSARLTAAAAGGLFFSWFGHAGEFAFFMLAVIILDYITGLAAGRVNEGLNSKRARKGLFKKFGLLVLFCMGFLLDVVFARYVSNGFNFHLPFDLPIGLIVSAWIIITEAISIVENLERLGVHVPKWLKKMLRKTRGEIYTTAEKSDEEEN